MSPRAFIPTEILGERFYVIISDNCVLLTGLDIGSDDVFVT